MSGFLTRRLQLAGARALGKGVRGALGKLIKQPKIKPKKAGDLVNKPSKAGKLLNKATEVFPFVGAKTPKKVPLKNTKATTIRGINIGTKAGKKFGETVKNQPKRIAGQDPVGRKPREMQAGGSLKALTARGLKEKKTEKGLTKNEAKAIGREFGRKKIDQATLQKQERDKRNKEVADKLKIKVFKKDGGGLKEIPDGNKGLPKLPTEVRNKMGFKKDGGLVSATAKLKAQGLKNGGAVRGKARGMGAATKGGGYNV
mgnify:FL=1